MKRLLLCTLALAALYLFSSLPCTKTSAQTAASSNTTQGGAVDVDRILAAFQAKETEFRRVLNGYGLKREAVIQSIGMGGQVTGEFKRVSYLTFDSQGNQREKIITFPLPTLPLDPADLEDLNTIEIYAIEAGKIDRYKFTYVGRERVDELDTYVFDVAPKVMPDPKKSRERFFQGRIWIDDRDMQLVKAKGKGVPEGKQRFPTFETYREQVDAHYWFPSLTYADDKLVMQNGNVVRLRMRIRFTDFENPPGEEMIPKANAATQPPPSAAAPTSTSQPTPVTGGVIVGKRIEMPSPKYPKEAKKAGITGTVRVRVVIDEKGRVIKAEAVDGPVELRDAAVEAAFKARFTPTLLEGNPVKVTGEINYNFNL